MSCYGLSEAKGKEHAKCAKECLMGGAPAGLLADNGKVYLLIDNHKDKKPYEELKKLGGEQVKVTGKMYTRNGISFIAVNKVEKS